MCPHMQRQRRGVLILLHMCPHTTMYVSSHYYIYVLILPYMCPRTTIYVSSHYYVCVLILPYICPTDVGGSCECRSSGSSAGAWRGLVVHEMFECKYEP